MARGARLPVGNGNASRPERQLHVTGTRGSAQFAQFVGDVAEQQLANAGLGR
jgi:hypothetical protein